MIAEVDRIVATWFGDATHGLNALIAVVPLDGTDTRPANIATITTEVANGDVARDGLPLDSDFPSVAISTDLTDQILVDSVSGEADAVVKLRVRIALDDPDTDAAKLAMSYYLRCALRSLRTLMRDKGANYSANRTRNQIYVESYEVGTVGSEWTKTEAGSAYVTGYLIATLRVRDRWSPSI